MTRTIGIDIGSGAVKSVLFDHSGDAPRWLARRSERIRRSDDRLDNDRVSLAELTTQVKRLHLNYLALSSQHLR